METYYKNVLIVLGVSCLTPLLTTEAADYDMEILRQQLFNGPLIPTTLPP